MCKMEEVSTKCLNLGYRISNKVGLHIFPDIRKKQYPSLSPFGKKVFSQRSYIYNFIPFNIILESKFPKVVLQKPETCGIILFLHLLVVGMEMKICLWFPNRVQLSWIICSWIHYNYLIMFYYLLLNCYSLMAPLCLRLERLSCKMYFCSDLWTTIASNILSWSFTVLQRMPWESQVESWKK